MSIKLVSTESNPPDPRELERRLDRFFRAIGLEIVDGAIIAVMTAEARDAADFELLHDAVAEPLSYARAVPIAALARVLARILTDAK